MSVVAVPARPADSGAAIANIALSVVLFACMDATVKWLSADYSIVQLLFFRSVFALIPLAYLMHRSGGWSQLKTRRPGLQLARSAVGLVSMGALFLAFANLPLADAVAIAFAGPLFLTLLSIPFLGERVGPRRWAAVGVGFLGILLIARPGAGVFGLAALLPLIGALGSAVAMILVRHLSRTDTNAAIIFYHAVVCILATGAALPFFWTMPAPGDWLPLIALGVVGGTAQIFMTQAFRLGEVGAIAPFKYTSIVFAILFGYLVFGDVPDAWTLAGAVVVIASGLYILHRETIRRRQALGAAG
ncbi:MAG: DMT family transporter [Alphaproteobacteria bacterium]|jgi:drug/metabolite transporter (DMT)-like permease|nr:DMT family transporter [Alphaproteobacteria bacterium]